MFSATKIFSKFNDNNKNNVVSRPKDYLVSTTVVWYEKHFFKYISDRFTKALHFWYNNCTLIYTWKNNNQLYFRNPHSIRV